MLDFATCTALSRAGIPQNCASFYYFREPYDAAIWSTEPVRPQEVPKGWPWCACPNSDELIAEIQARWPDYAICQGMDVTWDIAPASPMRVNYYDAWALGRKSEDDGDHAALAQGDSPVEALAALYIALAGQVQP